MNHPQPALPFDLRTDYFEAVAKIAYATMKKFGAEHFRWWMNSHNAMVVPKGSNPVATIDEISKFVNEQVTYSSWIVSDNHVRNVIKFTNNMPDTRTELRNIEVMRKAAVKAMVSDTQGRGKAVLDKYGPSYYKIRFLDSHRFAVIADLDEAIEDYESPLTANAEKDIKELADAIRSQYAAAKLPIPQLEIVAFNQNNEEIRQ